MKTRKIAAFLAAALTVTSLFGCGQQNTATTATESKTPTTESTATSETVVENKLPYEGVTLKALSYGGAGTLTEKNMDAINAILEEKLGLTLEVEFVQDAQQYNLALTAGDVYDIAYAADWMNFWANAEAGAFLEITDEELETYVPYIWENCREDCNIPVTGGKRYAVPKDLRLMTTSSYAVRGDLLKKYGMEDLDLSKIENMEKYLAAVKENETDMIPFDTPGNAFWNMLARYYASWGWCSVGTLSFGENVYYNVNDPEHKVFIAAEQPETLELLETLNRWYENGYFSQSVLSNTTKMLDSFKAGRSAVALVSSLNDAEKLCKEVAADERAAWDIKFVPYYTAAFYKSSMNSATAIPSTAKNKEAALSFINEVYTNKELYHLITYGLPETYTVDETGAITINVEQADTGRMRFGIEREEWNYAASLTDPRVLELQKHYNEITKVEAGVNAPIDTNSVTNIVTACNEVRNQYTVPRAHGVITGTPEEALAAEVKALKAAGIDEYIAVLQEQLDAFMAGLAK